jgi:hypothetical protein
MYFGASTGEGTVKGNVELEKLLSEKDNDGEIGLAVAGDT